MTMLKILQYPDPRLKRKGKKVTTFNDEIKIIIEDMFETLYHSENCAALAATQLSFDDPYHITVIDISNEKNEPICLVNGEIIERSGEQNEAEGCMSVPVVYDNVARSAKIKVRALDREGKKIEFEAEGYKAKCVQHELDHLDGKIFLDHLSAFKRRWADKKIKKFWQRMKRK